jgi:hypothetical protein
MELSAIRDAMQAMPFRPFSLRLADGRELFIRHPEFIAIAPNGWSAVVYDDMDSRMSILEPQLIVSIERFVPGSLAPGTPGPAAPSGDT